MEPGDWQNRAEKKKLHWFGHRNKTYHVFLPAFIVIETILPQF